MKKLLILTLVLGTALTANATLQISVNGDLNPVDSEIVIAPSDTLIMDIWTDSDISSGVGEGYWFLTCPPDKGTLSGGVSLWPDPVIEPSDPIIQQIAPGQDGVWGYIFLPPGSVIPAGSVIYDEINFHCESVGDAIVQLYWSLDLVTADLIDSVVVHQIPEPATIFLFGLGMLALRQKRTR